MIAKKPNPDHEGEKETGFILFSYKQDIVYDLNSVINPKSIIFFGKEYFWDIINPESYLRSKTVF